MCKTLPKHSEMLHLELNCTHNSPSLPILKSHMEKCSNCGN